MTKPIARPRMSSFLARRDRHSVYLTRLGLQKLTSYVRQTKNRRRYRSSRTEQTSPVPFVEPASPPPSPLSETCAPCPGASIAPLSMVSPEGEHPSPVPTSPPLSRTSEQPSDREMALTARIAELEKAKEESACILAYNLDYNYQERATLLQEQEAMMTKMYEDCDASYRRLRDRHARHKKRRDAHLAMVYHAYHRKHIFYQRRLAEAIALLDEFTRLPEPIDVDLEPRAEVDTVINWDKVFGWLDDVDSEADHYLGVTGGHDLRERVGRLQDRGFGLMPAARDARRAAQA